MVIAATTVRAQMLDFDGMPPYKLGITAGFNFPSFTASDCDITWGTQAGIDLLIDAGDLLDDTYFRAQLKYSMKGARQMRTRLLNDLTFEDYHVHYTTHYIELPIHYGYSYAIDSDWSILADTGPYFAIGLGGTSREHGTWANTNSFFKYNDASRFDYGWGLQAGLMFQQTLMLNVSYDWGFKNVSPAFLQNTNLGIGLTYFIE